MTAFDLHIVFDCADPDRVARFWREALGGYDFPMPVPDGFTSWDEWADAQGIPVAQRPTARTLVDKVRDRPDIFFLQVPEAKAGKNRLHLDVKVAQGLDGADRRARIEAEAERLSALGATIAVTVDQPEGFHLVMQDPEGNEFCVA
ncbi:VOC family protein [Streptomyces sp. SID13031]|uniref:VOC family protein n=1 Tax=Streptomyces sp. SID13031 TaxID=2706046 RepID=UPI0013C73294|nr:VOC family protein [Streptomyces sp. SID13031]NEA37056.1 VOC family protein [Streptomyces sp. SID13031]